MEEKSGEKRWDEKTSDEKEEQKEVNVQQGKKRCVSEEIQKLMVLQKKQEDEDEDEMKTRMKGRVSSQQSGFHMCYPEKNLQLMKSTRRHCALWIEGRQRRKK